MGYGLIALWRAETMKLRGTIAPWLALAAPALVFLALLSGLFSSGFLTYGTPATLWPHLMNSGWVLLLALCAPAVASFEAACLANLEHSGKQWKQLFTYPIPRWSVYAVKMLACLCLTAGVIAIGAAGAAGSVLVFSAARDLHMGPVTPWGEMGSIVVKATLACLPMIALQTWISSRYPGVTAGLALAFVAMIAGMTMLRPGDDVLMSYYPWTMPLRVIPVLNPAGAHSASTPAIAGCVEGIAAAVWACWDLGRRRDLV